MAEAAHPAISRIEHALARIEAAADTRISDQQKLQERHAKLRARITEAVEALDAAIARQDAD